MIVEWLTSPVLETEQMETVGPFEIRRYWGILVILSACQDVKEWHRVWRAEVAIS